MVIISPQSSGSAINYQSVIEKFYQTFSSTVDYVEVMSYTGKCRLCGISIVADNSPTTITFRLTLDGVAYEFSVADPGTGVTYTVAPCKVTGDNTLAFEVIEVTDELIRGLCDGHMFYCDTSLKFEVKVSNYSRPMDIVVVYDKEV